MLYEIFEMGCFPLFYIVKKNKKLSFWFFKIWFWVNISGFVNITLNEKDYEIDGYLMEH